ncbi:F-box only protein 21-like [Amphiura filiformis]|uniref:F-box only protein 21-like n=1 Tax=Amphiura filiformis TaxID=82378 RepID=UPI003B227603
MDPEVGADHVQNYDLFGLLADEIVIHILSDDAVGFAEICRFGQTCKRHLRVSQDQQIWQRKMLQVFEFPHLQHVAAKYPSNTDWRKLCVKLNQIPGITFTLLNALPHYHFESEEVPYTYFSPLQDLCGDKLSHHVLDLTLRNIYEDDNVNKNLTQKWYAKKAMRYVTHAVLKTEWKQFFDQPPEKQHLEDGAILFARWCQPLVKLETSDIKQKLNAIADAVKDELILLHGDEHPAAIRICNYDDERCIPSLSLDQSKQTLHSMNRVLYSKLAFSGNTQDYYNTGNSMINQVLESKCGIPITLSILYQSIARRLGVALKPVNFPGHFLLAFDMSRHDGYSHQQQIYIDPFHKGKQRTADECQELTNTRIAGDSAHFRTCAAKDVYLRMTNNLIRSAPQNNDNQVLMALELCVEINPSDADALIMLARFYIHMEINLEEILQRLTHIRFTNNPLRASLVSFLMSKAQEMNDRLTEQDRNREKKRRENNPEIIYSCGLVMRHKRYNYHCVIYGWDSVCEMSDSWQQQMRVHSLQDKNEQPFYNVYVEDGSSRYAAQENLQYPTSPITITHPDVGKCFEEFNEHYYVMNEAWQKKYPDDNNATRENYENHYGRPDC